MSDRLRREPCGALQIDPDGVDAAHICVLPKGHSGTHQPAACMVEDLTPHLEASLWQRLPVLRDELAAAGEECEAAEKALKAANVRRRAAKNKIAEVLQALGMTGFSIGNG